MVTLEYDVMDAPEVFPLATAEQDTLARCEAVIGEGLQTYIEVGRAMAIIRDDKLYRQHYDTWEEYCVDRWGMSRQRAYQLIDASQVADDLSTIVDTSEIPESHMRVIAKAPPADRPRVIERADEIRGDKPRTAKHIEQAAAEIAAPDLPLEFAIIQRRYASHRYMLASTWDGVTRRYVVRKDGGSTGVVMTWDAVLTKLERIEAEPEAPAQPPPPPPSYPENASAYDQQEKADIALMRAAHDAIEACDYAGARMFLDQVQVATYERDQVLATLVRSEATRFWTDQTERRTRFSPQAMISLTTWDRALAHIAALLELAT